MCCRWYEPFICNHDQLHERAAQPDTTGCGRAFFAELAGTIRRVVGFEGSLRFDTSKPDGAPRKLLDTRRLTELGWVPRIGLEAGIRSTYDWFLNNLASLKT